MSDNVKIGICEWALPGGGLYGAKIASELGLDGIELELGSYERDFPLSHKEMQDSYREAALRWGIEYPSIAVNDLCQHGMTNEKGSEKRAIATEGITRGIDTAYELNIPLVQLPSFEDGEIKNEKDFNNVADCLKYACKYAKDKGIVIGTENLLTVEENLKMIEMVGYDNLKVYFDSQNYFLFKDYNTQELLDRLVKHICEIHVKDGNGHMSGSLLGKGNTGFYETIKILKKHNYSGWVQLENYYDQKPLSLEAKDPYKLLREDIKILKEALGK